MDGWIKLHRKLSENPFWLCEPFSRGQAWVDLLMLANHKRAFFYIRNIKITLNRGQVGWSQPKLAERWGWSRTKVKKFLKDLAEEQQIKQDKNTIIQVITIVNFHEYQENGQQKSSRRAAEEQQRDLDKNDKNDKNLSKRKFFIDIFEIFYFKNMKNPCSEVEKFFDHYSKSDWVDKNGNEIKNTLAAARAWESKNKEKNCPVRLLTQYKKVYDHIKSQTKQYHYFLDIVPRRLNKDQIIFSGNKTSIDIIENSMIKEFKEAMFLVFGKINIEYIK